MRKKLFYHLLILFVLFPISTPARAETINHVVISKIQITGVTTKDEFVELYNPTVGDISLLNWRLSKQTASGNSTNLLTTFPEITLPPGGTFRIVSPDYAGGEPSNAMYSTQNSIAEDNTITLYNDAGVTIIDRVGFGTATLFEGSPVPNPENGVLTRRHADGAITDTDNNATDFAPSNEEATSEPPTASTPPTTNSSVSSGGGGNLSIIGIGTVRINEFVSDPADNDVEWIELFNTGIGALTLDGWTIEDGSKQTTKLVGAFDSNGFFVVTSPKGQLNNAGDNIVLKAPSGTIIDSVAYGDWDNNKNTNAPTASDPNGVARGKDGVASGNDAEDFVRTTTPTKGSANIITGPTPATGGTATATKDLVINELFPNPLGSDGLEFIELQNIGTKTIEVADWTIATANGQSYRFDRKNFPVTLIDAGGYFLISRQVSGIALSNHGGDTVRLIPPGKTRAVDTATYTGDALENQSYSLTTDGWTWSETPTPSAANHIVQKDKPPVPVLYLPKEVDLHEAIVMSAEDSFDPEHEPLNFFWSLGDGASANGEIIVYTFQNAGTYTVSLTVSDDHGNKQSKKQEITVGKNRTATGQVAGTNITTSPLTINELLPSPRSNETEWIELYNASSADVSLNGWSMTDDSSHRFTFPSTAMLSANGYLIIPQTESHITLNNDGDTITLFKEDMTADVVSYGKGQVGSAYARNDNDRWIWTATPTPGNTNDVIPKTVTTDGETTVVGTVLAEPGTVGAHALYLTRIVGNDELKQVRVDLNPSINFTFERGNELQVSGKLHMVSGEPRITVSSEENISLVGEDEAPLETQPYSADSAQLGTLMAVAGTVGRGSSSGFTLNLTEDETLRIVMPVGVSPKRPYPIGTPLTVHGILSLTSAGFRLLVRDEADLIPEVTTTPTIPAVREPETTPNPWAENYFLMTALGCLLTGGILAYRWWRIPSALPFDIIDEEETV